MQIIHCQMIHSTTNGGFIVNLGITAVKGTVQNTTVYDYMYNYNYMYNYTESFQKCLMLGV